MTPTVEDALVELAHLGMWFVPQDGRLLIATTCAETDDLPDALTLQLADHRAELLKVIPGLEAENLALTGPVVRVLFARLSDSDQQQARDLQECSDYTLAHEYFTENYDRLSMAEKVIYLWAVMDGPRLRGMPTREAIDTNVADQQGVPF